MPYTPRPHKRVEASGVEYAMLEHVDDLARQLEPAVAAGWLFPVIWTFHHSNRQDVLVNFVDSFLRFRSQLAAYLVATSMQHAQHRSSGPIQQIGNLFRGKTLYRRQV